VSSGVEDFLAGALFCDVRHIHAIGLIDNYTELSVC
jgi:hypothetical protein